MFAFKKQLFILLSFTFIFLPLPSCKKAENQSSYTINAVYSNGVIDGNLRYKFVNNSNTAIDHVDFNLHANAYAENAEIKPTTSTNLAKAYENGISYGGIEILSVEIARKKSEFKVFGLDNAFLKVSVPAVYPEEYVEIDVAFKTTVPKSKLRLGENSHAINVADFFPTVCYFTNGEFLHIPYSPIGDPYYSQTHDFFVNFSVPSEYVVASCGQPTQTIVDELFTTYSYQLNRARNFALVISKNFKVFSKNSNGITVNYYSFLDDGEEYLNTVLSALDYFNRTFGDYPYQTLSVAETGFVYGGMEFSSLCFINTDLNRQDKLNSIIHEVAHQWWYGGVSNNQYNTAFIDEGLCEFSTYLYFKNTSKDLANEMILNAKQAYKSFFDLQSVLSGNANTCMERPLSDFKSDYEYVNLVYNKSLLTFYEYENLVGEDKTLKSLKTLYKNNIGKEITREDLIKAFGYGDHFNSYIDGKVIL